MKSDPSPLRSLAISSCNFFKLKSLWIHKGFVILSIVQFSRYLFISCSLFSGDKRLIYYITSFEICQPLFLKFFKFLFDAMLSLLSGNFLYYIILSFVCQVLFFISFISFPSPEALTVNSLRYILDSLSESLFIISWFFPFVNGFLHFLPFAHNICHIILCFNLFFIVLMYFSLLFLYCFFTLNQ